MNQANIKTGFHFVFCIFLIFGICFFPISVFSQSECGNSPPEYFLSLAFERQANAARIQSQEQFQEESKKIYEESLEYYNRYIHCSEELQKEVSPVSRVAKASVHFFLEQLENASKEVDAALISDSSFRDGYILKAKILIRFGEFQKASDFLETNLSRFPDDSDFLYLLGTLNQELKNYPRAILYLTSLSDTIRNREGNPKYRSFVDKSLGEIYFANAQPKKALYFLNSYLHQNPSDLSARLTLAKIWNQLGKFSSARKELNRILKTKKNLSSVEHLLAEMYFIESRASAFEYFNILNKNSKIPKGGVLEGLYLILQGKTKQAKVLLLAVKEKFPSRLAVRLAMLDVYETENNTSLFLKELKEVAELVFGMQQFELAERIAQRALSVSNKSSEWSKSEIYDFLASCHEQSGYIYRAILMSRKAVENSKKEEETLKFQLHLAYLLRNDPPDKKEEAETLIRNVLQIRPEMSYARYLLGVVLASNEKYKEALEELNVAIETDPENPVYYFYRASVHERLEQQEFMERDLKKSIEIDPGNPVAYNYLGYYLSEKGVRLEESLSLVQKAVELAPDNEAYQDSLGWIFFKLGNHEEALLHLQLAYQILKDKGGEDPVILEHLGDVYKEKNQGGNAVAYWEKSLKLFKKKEDIYRIQKKIQTGVRQNNK
ncbi:tetratricopeptide repeat protein [Leptospira interrogans]|uniref:Tetratricopeptide repeat protein n=4 Tax=Leptospira interrogans TaxID=173 RepID=A0A0E2D409_LEPIR|nr:MULTISPECIES: tetratricopeptide repeat protein [Leptospira]EJO79334.1 tetratricopeptide repeat protein [Leptospira interrogans serovar Pomona str. Kennewicki LC82-25]EJP13831.1 tetratricopeptide repeat protein [Leptospira interrogans str. FPW2026]EKN95815.1 tetratricopeptide repeat protein [Leptospira interrogans serovar Pomona str. Pomona]EKO08169.1 tetratricopeptide repeat protein [Leptospira interrogans str. C10069]EKO69044.1 tetratricopeptide repeat protein [Leptospira interrogans serov